jgi:flagellar motor switch protein FliG
MGRGSSPATSPGRHRHAETAEPTSPPLRCLEDASSGALARYLQREQPQTIAVVISQLTSDRAAEVLALLPAELQGEVTLRLVHLDQTDPEILEEIERGMQSWIWQQSRSTRSGVAGLETLRGILAAADEGAKNTILRNLAQRDRRLASKLNTSPRRQITFADLEQFADTALANVLRQAPAEIVLLALAGARRELVERVMRLLPAEDARLLRQGLDHFGPTRLSDVEQAQQELADLARQFAPSALEGRDEKKHLSVAV